MATARKQDDGRWAVQVYVRRDIDGKQRRKRIYGRTKREAELAAAQWEVKKQHNVGAGNLTVGKAIDDYIEERSNILSPSSIRTYKRIARNIESWFLMLPLESVEAEDIQKLVNRYAATHAPKTVKSQADLIIAVWKKANDGRVPKIVLPRLERKEVSVPEPEDIETLLQFVKGTDYEIPILLASHMGLRREEICALTWTDINFEEKSLTVKSALVKDDKNQWVKKTTKAEASKRVLLIPERVLNVLDEKREPTGNVCKLKPSTLTSKLPGIIQRAGLPPFTIHTLRHYYASVLLSIGVPINYVADELGHATNSMAERVYGHIMSGAKTQIRRKILTHFNGNGEQESEQQN